MKTFSQRNPNEPVRILLIGAGKMGAAHAAVLNRIPEAQLVGVASRSGETARHLARQTAPNIAWNRDWQVLAAETGAEACVVAVSHLANPEITEQVLETGLHVLAEKPVAFDSRTALRLAALAESRGLVNWAAVNRRFFPSLQRALAISELNGPLLGITVQGGDPVAPYRKSAKHDRFVYDHWMLFQTIHLIDALRMLGGPIASIHGYRRFGVETNVAAMIQFRSGVVANYSGFSSRTRWEICLHCEGFELQLDNLENCRLVTQGGKSSWIYPARSDRPDRKLKLGLLEQNQAFVRAIRDSVPCAFPASDFRDHAESIGLVETFSQLPESSCACHA